MNRRELIAAWMAALFAARSNGASAKNNVRSGPVRPPNIERLSDVNGKPVYETDVCIIGAGAAGITLARSLASTGVQCLLLESGDFQLDVDTQTLADAEHTGLTSSRVCRLRYFGGTTNHWGGWCAPLNEEDFAERAWVPDSGWPISYSQLDTYYPAAQALCELGPFRYTAEALSSEQRDFTRFDTDQLTARFYQFSDPPTRFGTAYREDLQSASNITLLLQANVVELEADASVTRVRAAKLRALDGSVGEVRAKRFVLACGAVENARLLLLSNSAEPAGLGNRNGLVGRYFMQHPHVAAATLLTREADLLEPLFARHAVGAAKVRASLSPSAAVQAERRLLNCAATLDRTPDPVTGYGALRYIWRDIRNGQWPEDLGLRMRRAFGDPGSMADSDKLMTLYMRSEQAPNPDSRITLSDEVDALGLRRARIDWQLSETDKRTIAEGAKAIGESLSGMGLGSVRLAPWLQNADANWPAELWGGCHHMGTTRMSRTAESGVVDEQCRVHNIDNLYVAGSSVFPTAGYANPTLTIVALALRLAEHLRDSA